MQMSDHFLTAFLDVWLRTYANVAVGTSKLLELLPRQLEPRDTKSLAQRYLRANAKKMHSVTNTGVCFEEK